MDQSGERTTEDKVVDGEMVKVTVYAEIVYIEQWVGVHEGDDAASLTERVKGYFFDDGVETPYSGWVTRVEIPDGAIEQALKVYEAAP